MLTTTLPMPALSTRKRLFQRWIQSHHPQVPIDATKSTQDDFVDSCSNDACEHGFECGYCVACDNLKGHWADQMLGNRGFIFPKVMQ